MQRKRIVNISQQSLKPVAEFSMPRQERWAAVNVRCLVDLILLVPMRHAIRIEVCRFQRNNGVSQPVSFTLRDLGYVSANPIGRTITPPIGLPIIPGNLNNRDFARTT